MKFETQVHYFLDAIRKGRVLFDRHAADFPTWLSEHRAKLPYLEKLPVYVLRESVHEAFDQTVTTLAGEWVDQGRILLPYPAMFWEFRDTSINCDPRPGSWLAYTYMSEDTGDTIWIVVYYQPDVTDPHKWLHIPGLARIKDRRLDYMHHLRADGAEDDPDLTQSEMELVYDITSYVCSSLVLLDSPSIEIETVKVPREINRGRKLMNRPSVPDHTVIRLPKIVYAGNGEDQGGTHKRPRCHWRRPHRREYKPGEWTNIPLTLVARREDEPPPPPPVVEIVTHRKEPKS